MSIFKAEPGPTSAVTVPSTSVRMSAVENSRAKARPAVPSGRVADSASASDPNSPVAMMLAVLPPVSDAPGARVACDTTVALVMAREVAKPLSVSDWEVSVAMLAVALASAMTTADRAGADRGVGVDIDRRRGVRLRVHRC